MDHNQFQNSSSPLELEAFFLGKTEATGIFEDRFGNIRRQFVVDITGTMEGDKLVLDEFFSYVDGTEERRVWTIERTSPTTYSGRADDILGEAIGEISGNVVRWTYKTNIEVNGSPWTVGFDDWMLLQENGVLLNRATVSRFGIKIGTVLIAFHKLDEIFEPSNEVSLSSDLPARDFLLKSAS